MSTEKSEGRRGTTRQTFSLSIPEEKLARIAEGERVALSVDGITIRARKHAGHLVRDTMASESVHDGRDARRPKREVFSKVRLQSKSPRQALLERLAKLVGRFPDETITEALSQDDVGTFTTLSSPEAWGDERTSPTDKARLRGIQARNSLLADAGGSLTVEIVAKMLGVSEEAIRKRLRNRTLVGVKSAKGYLIPAVQFEEGRELAGLREVLRVMPVESPWMRLNWLMSPEPRLHHSKPVDVLREGKHIEEAIKAAELYGEQGAV